MRIESTPKGHFIPLNRLLNRLDPQDGLGRGNQIKKIPGLCPGFFLEETHDSNT